MSDVNDWNQKIIKEFRANAGKVSGPFEGANLLLLHTTGKKSGQPRINPVMYLPDGDRYVIVASKAGASTDPDWYRNLVANPEIRVEVGTEEIPVLATVAPEPERTRLYEKMEAVAPGFTEYRNKTHRVIPVVILTRRAS